MEATTLTATLNSVETHIHHNGECYKILHREECKNGGELQICYTVKNKKGEYIYFYFTYSQKIFRNVTK